MSHGGGGVRKVPKKCHVLFEWPLTTSAVNTMIVTTATVTTATVTTATVTTATVTTTTTVKWK